MDGRKVLRVLNMEGFRMSSSRPTETSVMAFIYVLPGLHIQGLPGVRTTEVTLIVSEYFAMRCRSLGLN